MEENPEGDYILFSDHQALMEEQKTRLAKIIRGLGEIVDYAIRLTRKSGDDFAADSIEHAWRKFWEKK